MCERVSVLGLEMEQCGGVCLVVVTNKIIILLLLSYSTDSRASLLFFCALWGEGQTLNSLSVTSTKK